MEGPPPTRPRRRRPRPLAIAGALVLGLLLLEGAVRVRQWLRYGTTQASFYHLAEDPASGLTIPEPGHTIGPITIDSRGFRSPELIVPKPPGTVRIGFLGGSTTFCAEATSLAHTWPALLVDKLHGRDPEVSFDFVNGAAAGYSTEQSRTNLLHRLAPLAPDVLVIYHGTNDLTHDSRELAAAEGLYDPDKKEKDWLGQYWLSWYLVKKNVLFRSRLGGAEGAEQLQLDPARISGRFRARLTELVRAAQRVAPVVLLVTFSQRTRAEQSPAEREAASSSSLYYMPYLDTDALIAGFAEYNRVVREVAREEGVVLIEGEDEIPGDEEHFADSVHFTDRGCELQAERVFAGLAEAPAYRALMESRTPSGASPVTR